MSSQSRIFTKIMMTTQRKLHCKRLEMLKPPKEHLVEKYFHPDNMLSTEKLKIQPAKVRDEFKKLQSDCGSARVQDMEENPKKAKKSRGGGTCFWTSSMDEILIAAYLHQQTLGNTNGNCMTPSAMDNILLELRNHFPDKPISKEKIKDHMKHIKGKFKNCYNIFKNGPSGFAWDATTNMWIAKPEVWDKLIEAKPDAAEWRNKPILYYDKLAQLFGKSQAVRVHAETAVKLRAKGITYGGNGYDNTTEDENLIPTNNITLEDFETVDEEFYANSSPKRPYNGHSQDTTSCRTKKRAKKMVEDDINISHIAKSIEKMVEVFDNLSRSIIELIKQNKNANAEDVIWAQLEDIGVEPTLLPNVYMYLVQNPLAVKTFSGITIHRRKEMLHRIVPGYPPNH